MQVHFPAVTLSEMGMQSVSFSEIKHSMVSKDRSPNSVSFYCYDLGGSANSHIVEAVPSSSAACRRFSDDFGTLKNHSWAPQYIFLINRPCYIAVETGLVFHEDGRVILDTVYPSTGELSLSRVSGLDLPEANLQSALRDAPELGDALYVPLLSRWSAVYFHAITESLVQDHILNVNDFSPLARYLAPNSIKNAQLRVIETVAGQIESTNSAIVRVSRVAFTSALYCHSVFSIDFLNFVRHTKLRALAPGLPLDPGPWEKLYVTRESANARRMTNERELVAELLQLGFRLVDCGSMSFDEQVRVFQNARLVMGPHGAGLTNAAFSRPGCTICELRSLNRECESPYWGVSYLKLSSIMGFRYCMHVSENPPHSDEWQANIPEIVLLAKRLLGH